ARRLRLEVSKNSSTALSSHDGAFATSTTTRAPLSTSASPSPVTVLTPEEGEAATTSCPFWRRLFTSFVPINPLPPITTILMFVFICVYVDENYVCSVFVKVWFQVRQRQRVRLGWRYFSILAAFMPWWPWVHLVWWEAPRSKTWRENPSYHDCKRSQRV